MNIEIDNIISKIQPHYDKLNSRFSKSYLSGSCWYVGDSIKYWWDRCDKIYNFTKNINKLRGIVYFIKLDYENRKKLLVT